MEGGSPVHWLMTRFNVPMGRCPGRGLDPVWLSHRARLFETYCLPSVAAQSDQGFAWVVMFDPETPAAYAPRVAAWQAIRPFRAALWGGDWPTRLRQLVGDDAAGRPVLTTRLDNDDAIHRDFLATARSAPEGRRLEFVEFPRGLELDEGRGLVRRLRWPSNAFLSLFEPEPGARPLTAYAFDHSRARLAAPMRAAALDPAWLRVVHDANLANRLHDGPTLDAPGLLRDAFGILDVASGAVRPAPE